MTPPFERQQAFRNTRHHMLFEKPQWKARPKAQEVHQHGSYIIGLSRARHDYLHSVIKPVPVPHNAVLDTMMDIGKTYSGWQNDNDRVERMLDDLVGEAKAHPSPEKAHQLWEVSTSLAGQLAVVQFFKGAEPRYE